MDAPETAFHWAASSDDVVVLDALLDHGADIEAPMKRTYGSGRWRKRKGLARVRLADGTVCRVELHWYEATGIGRREYKIKAYIDWFSIMAAARCFVLCLRNTGYEVSLERRKIYQVLPDRTAAAHQQVRVIDESGEDYLFPASYFLPINLPPALRRAVLAAV